MDLDWLLPVIQNNIQWAPFLIFGLLMLAGINIPVSEDAMIFITALLSHQYPDQLYRLLTALYLGIFISDLVTYYIGRFLGDKLWHNKYFSKIVSKEKVKYVEIFYQKYGPITLIVGRFIPFGVRNALFLTAGIGKMNFFKFALSDFLACTISTTVFFNLYHRYGYTVIEFIKKWNLIIFTLGICVAVIFIWKKRTDKAKLLKIPPRP